MKLGSDRPAVTDGKGAVTDGTKSEPMGKSVRCKHPTGWGDKPNSHSNCQRETFSKFCTGNLWKSPDLGKTHLFKLLSQFGGLKWPSIFIFCDYFIHLQYNAFPQMELQVIIALRNPGTSGQCTNGESNHQVKYRVVICISKISFRNLQGHEPGIKRNWQSKSW